MTPILLDTSSWVEYLRDTGSTTCERVDELIRGDSVMATTGIEIMELLAGAEKSEDRKRIRALMNRCAMFSIRPLFEYEKAAELYVAVGPMDSPLPTPMTSWLPPWLSGRRSLCWQPTAPSNGSLRSRR